MTQNKDDKIGLTLIFTLFILLSIAGYLSYKSIDKDILHKLESKTLIVTTPVPISTQSAQTK